MYNQLTPFDIENMSYVDFISLLRETNRCPGGEQTINKIVSKTFLDRESKVLDVGSNTGFTSFEIARLAKCHVNGIDVSETAVNTAIDKLKEDTEDMQNRVKFTVASAYNLPFKDNSFDVVVVGGATSFMDKKSKAVSEYFRVLKPWGFVSITNLFYKTKPSATLLSDLSEILGVNINPWTLGEWLDVLKPEREDIELYHKETNDLVMPSADYLREYVDSFLVKDHLVKLDGAVKEVIKNRWINTLNVFNENNKHLGYVLLLLRKRKIIKEPSLFS